MEAIIFSGVQGVGKSTFFRERFVDTHIRINLDMLKTRHRENLLLRACFDAKQSFVVDNTNSTIAERKKYIDLAKQARFNIVGFYFESRIEDALRRNELREANRQAPRIAIFATHKKLQIPSFAEGFDVLNYVRIEEDDRFVVEAWRP